MNLIRKGHRQSHRGVIGVESAIVMIAFVIVAAALAFVVLNMGFSTTQKAKTTIVSGLGEASSSLEISGKVFGSGHVSAAKLNVTAFPIKIASGGESVNLDVDTAGVKYLSNTISYDNIYAGTLTTTAQDNDDGTADGQWVRLENATESAKDEGYITDDPFEADGSSWPSETKAFIYWTVNDNNNDILDQGEHAVLAIVYAADDRPSALDKVRAEILIPTGAALTVERQVPSITTEVVDLG
ncbi:MAG: archaellin/type IV pilin N-terminal domain-containing protein [Thermoproteota archaeon]